MYIYVYINIHIYIYVYIYPARPASASSMGRSNVKDSAKYNRKDIVTFYNLVQIVTKLGFVIPQVQILRFCFECHWFDKLEME